MKYVCHECGWHGDDKQILRAKNPFAPEDELFGCPECRDITLRHVCDEVGCWQEQTCGTPTKDGYRLTCYDHKPIEED